MRSVRKAAAVISVGTLAAGLSLGVVGAGQAAASTRAAGRTVALQATGKAGSGRASFEPGTLEIDEGGPDLWASHLRWSRWGTATATGSGQLVGADADLMYFGTATIKLSDPSHRSGTRYFEKIHIIGGKPGFAHYWHWTWSEGSYIG